MYGIVFDRALGQSQFRQLVDRLREGIQDGAIGPGEKLASTRDLARSLGISRSLVLEAIDQLKLEGYLETFHGSGTRVRAGLTMGRGLEGFAQASVGMADTFPPESKEREKSISFVPGPPEVEDFPRRRWLACYARALEYADAEDLSYNRSSGRRDLRLALQRYLYRVKGIRSRPEQIIVTSGSSRAFSIIAEAIGKPCVAMEDPAAPFAREVLAARAENLIHLPVDTEGLMPEFLPRSFDLVYATPAHQFPLGAVLPAERRVQLIAKARAAGAWIIEDDYDSEYRHDLRPVSPLHSMAPDRVVYVGSMSKLLSPAIRIGFMVVPPGLLERVRAIARRWDNGSEGLQQKALARFIEEGHFERFLRARQRRYKKKNLFLLGLIERELGPVWRVGGAKAGMHIVLYPPESAGQEACVRIREKLAAQGFFLDLVSDYLAPRDGEAGGGADAKCADEGLLLSYARPTEAELTALIEAIRVEFPYHAA